MKKSTFLRIAMAFSLVLLVSGAFAQINLTIKNADGTNSNAAVVYTIHSSTGAVVVIQTANAGGLATWTPVNGSYNYLVRNSLSNQWNAYSVTYTGVVVNATITLSTSFNPTLAGATDYVANRTANKVTTGKPMPFWVYPSPVQNPSWTAPAAPKATAVSLIANLNSTFAWTYTPAANVADAHVPTTDNYVELTFTPALAAITTTASYELSAVETAAAAYGGCLGQAVKQYVTIINPPYIRISTATTSGTYQVSGTPINHIVAGCAGSIAATNIALAMDNTNEEFPYYTKLDYKVFNATMAAGNNLTLGADITAATMTAFPALDVIGQDAVTHANNTTNPYKMTATPQNLYGAVQTFQMMNNAITVYQFDFQSWNAKISRKCDYVAIRNAAGDETLITDANYTWYNTKWAAGDVIKAYIIVFPQPVTGPIYHIPNSWAL